MSASRTHDKPPLLAIEPRAVPPPDAGAILRVASYNIHGCIGDDRKADPRRVADVVAEINADLIAFQEVDAVTPTIRARSQTGYIGELLGLEHVYFPVETKGLHAFGLAVLSRWPIEEIGFARLPNLYPALNPRKRGVMRAVLATPAGRVHLINTHLSLFKIERQNQLHALFNWTGLSAPLREPIMLCGDLNAGPRSLTYYKMSRRLTDVHVLSGARRPPKATFHARRPVFRIDHIFVSHHFSASQVVVVRSRKTAKASDHLPLMADLRIK